MFSESIWLWSSEEFSARSVVSYDHNHLIKFGAHLYTTCQSAVRWLGTVWTEESCLLKGQGFIALLVPWVRDNYRTLGAWDSSIIEVNWDLIWFHLWITTSAISYLKIIRIPISRLRKIPGTLFLWMISRRLSPEKPATLLGTPSGGTTLTHTLSLKII